MNEELKIIIKAITTDAQKSIKEIKKELGGISGSAKGASGGFGSAMKSMGKAAIIAVGAIAAIGTAIVALGKKTLEFQRQQAQLNSAFLAAGSTTKVAANTYKDMFRFLGESDKAIEASNLLAKLTTDEQKLTEWTKTLQGVYATFPDSLPIEGLVEASNETARVGKITGVLADALNWAGVSEDEFNQKLATTSTFEEREALIRSTLNGLYKDASEIYEQNSKAILEQNEAQARLENSMAAAGKVIVPFITAITNLGAVLFDTLKPALDVIVPILTTFVNWITEGIKAVLSFIGVVSGSSTSVETFAQSTSGISSAATSADKLAAGFDDVKKSAEAAKKVTMGFDELNIVSSGSSTSGSGSSSGGSSEPSYTAPDMSKFTVQVTESENKVSGLSKLFDKIKTTLKEFADFTGLTDMFVKVKESVDNFGEGLANIWESFTTAVEERKPQLEDFALNVQTTFETVSNTLTTIWGDMWLILSEKFLEFTETNGAEIEKYFSTTLDIILQFTDLVVKSTDDIFKSIRDWWDKDGKRIWSEVVDVINDIGGWVLKLWNEWIYPVIKDLGDHLTALWNDHLKPLWDKVLNFLTSVWDFVKMVWDGLLKPLVDWIIEFLGPGFVKVFRVIWDIVQDVFGAIADAVGGILDALGGLLDFITGVFTGNWEKAWNGIKKFFKGIWDAIWGIIKGVINLIIDALNLLWTGLYTALSLIINGVGSIVKSIGSLLGQDDWGWEVPKTAPKIPRLAKGGIVDRATLAVVGERGKEAIVPLENNTNWMDKLVTKFAEKTNQASRVALIVDGKERGWATINNINRITAETGDIQLKLV